MLIDLEYLAHVSDLAKALAALGWCDPSDRLFNVTSDFANARVNVRNVANEESAYFKKTFWESCSYAKHLLKRSQTTTI
jgi:hypothetical protein